MSNIPPEVTISFSRILIPWGVKTVAKADYIISDGLTNACAATIIETLLPKEIFKECVISDIGGNQSPPHTICFLDGEIIHEDGSSDPFTWEARAPFNAFKGLTHIEYKIEHKQSDSFPPSLSPQEIALSLPIKVKDLIIMITYYQPKHSRYFGPSASAVGSLALAISDTKVAVEITSRSVSKELALKFIENKFSKLFADLNNCSIKKSLDIIQ